RRRADPGRGRREPDQGLRGDPRVRGGRAVGYPAPLRPVPAGLHGSRSGGVPPRLAQDLHRQGGQEGPGKPPMSALQRLGWKGLVVRGWQRATARLARAGSDIVLIKELDESGDAPLRSRLQVSAHDGGDPAFLDRIPATWRADPDQVALLRIYARRGYRALFAEMEGTIVGHMWWVDGRAADTQSHPHLTRYGVRLGPREPWAFNFFLDPRYRGGGNANEFLARFERHL